MNLDTIKDFFSKTSSIENIVLGVAGSLIFLGMQKTYNWGIVLFKNLMLFRFKIGYSFDGYWANVENEKEEVIRLNINKIIQKKHNVIFYVWQYSPNEVSCKRYFSRGIIKGNHLSAYYYLCDNEIPETGALTFKLEGQRLVGPYVQYSVEKKTAELLIAPEGYNLQRIQIAFKTKLLMLFGLAPFRNYQEAYAAIQGQNRFQINV